uniref:RIKEN cDNA 4921536K21 gene n=1 Tax=Jaculus jaculus TaxID=51337 RepID=A0A8C5P1Z7_JACJA
MSLKPDSFSDSITSLDMSSMPCRPSVKWDLGLPVDFEAATKAATGSGILSDLDFRRGRLDSRPDLGHGVQPQVSFLRPLVNSNEVTMRKLLPKSHLSRVIIRDNLSAQRLYEMEVRAADKTKKKMSHLYDHLINKFMNDQRKKLGRWRRESLNIQDYLDANRI